ncbi:hypothetical protein C0Q70_10456 [Pomacea canaliculata]|uniref:Hexosyltransferase n=1 Tax=Pomacea canaliculata TaxID=400727 RepID=A0A2T7P390_POMCA|nr:hypothetical protein C0Q70_10456 [Pomacea canaliculata]
MSYSSTPRPVVSSVLLTFRLTFLILLFCHVTGKYSLVRGCYHPVNRGRWRYIRCLCLLVFVFFTMLFLLLASCRLIPRDMYHVTDIEDALFFDWMHGDYFRLRVEEEQQSVTVPSIIIIQPSPDAPTSCTNDTYIVALVASLPSEASSRHTVRVTWGQAAITRTWPAAVITAEVRLFFFLGKPRTDAELQWIQKEAEDFQDLVVMDFEDTYRNLTLKTLAGLNWISQHCSQASFVLKADQDTFVHIPRLLTLLYTYQNVFRNALLGQVMYNPPVVTSGKWAITEDEYPFSTYASFASGPCYLLDNTVVPDLLVASRYMPYIPFEDVFMGCLAKTIGLSRLRVEPFLIDQFHNKSFCSFTHDRDSHIALTCLSSRQMVGVWEVLGQDRQLC